MQIYIIVFLCAIGLSGFALADVQHRELTPWERNILVKKKAVSSIDVEEELTDGLIKLTNELPLEYSFQYQSYWGKYNNGTCRKRTPYSWVGRIGGNRTMSHALPARSIVGDECYTEFFYINFMKHKENIRRVKEDGKLDRHECHYFNREKVWKCFDEEGELITQ